MNLSEAIQDIESANEKYEHWDFEGVLNLLHNLTSPDFQQNRHTEIYEQGRQAGIHTGAEDAINTAYNTGKNDALDDHTCNESSHYECYSSDSMDEARQEGYTDGYDTGLNDKESEMDDKLQSLQVDLDNALAKIQLLEAQEND
jgi:flagellar biosynthesis/type III secretory pathway protein FliH